MTGNELKDRIKRAGLTQEVAAEKMGITRATLNNWCKQAYISPQIVNNVRTLLGFDVDVISPDAPLLEVIKSQQRTIENLSETIKNLTIK